MIALVMREVGMASSRDNPDGTPCMVKAARTVWSGGKIRDSIKDLPITMAHISTHYYLHYSITPSQKSLKRGMYILRHRLCIRRCRIREKKNICMTTMNWRNTERNIKKEASSCNGTKGKKKRLALTRLSSSSLGYISVLTRQLS